MNKSTNEVPAMETESGQSPKWWRCDTHGAAHAGAWGCPECVRELRGERRVLEGWITSALLVLRTLDAEDSEDGGEELRKLLEDGVRLVCKHPATQKQEERSRSAAAMTMADLVDDYRAKALQPGQLAPGTITYREADFDMVILPRFRSWEVRKVTSLDVVQMLKDAKRTWAITKRVLTSMSKLMDHAMGMMVIPANPCTGIKLSALMGPKPTPRRRVMLDAEELRTILPTIDDTIGRINGLAFRIQMATCVRGVELVKARKEHINLETGSWWVPDENVKTRSGFLVPLSPPVVEWMKELIALSGDSDYLLPARREDRGDTHIGRTTLLAAFKRAFARGDIDIRAFTPHDTRSTAKGHLRNLGFSREISEIALNHALKGMDGIYDVREEIPERRRALSAWTDFLIQCETGQKPTPPSNVIQMRRVA